MLQVCDNQKYQVYQYWNDNGAMDIEFWASLQFIIHRYWLPRITLYTWGASAAKSYIMQVAGSE